MISHARNREDVLLARAFAHQSSGFFVDVGAHDPVYDSVTKYLTDHGWNGINVEPNPGLIYSFQKSRPRDINLAVAVASKPSVSTFFEVTTQPQLSTLSAIQADTYLRAGHLVREHQLSVVTLSDLLSQHVGSRTIDLLSIDTEGAEREVLEGMDFNRWQPRVLLIEATQPMTNTPTHNSWDGLIPRNVYDFVLFDGINRWYVRRGESDLADKLSYPVNCLDNYITVEEFDRHQRECTASFGRPARLVGKGVQRVCNAVNWLVGRGRSSTPVKIVE